MSYYAPQFLFFSALMLCLGILFGWLMWGKLKRKLTSLEKNTQARIYDLGIDLQARRNRIEELEGELQTKIDRITYLDRAIIGLRTSYDDATSSRESIQDRLDTAVVHCSEQEQEQLALRAQLENKTEEVEELKTLLGKATEQNNQLNTKLQNSKEEVELLRENLPIIRNLEAQLENANNESQSLAAKTTKLSDEIKYLKSKLSEGDELKTQLGIAKERINTLTKELDGQRTKLLERNKEFESQVVSFTNLQNEYKNTSNKQKEIETELQKERDKIVPLEKQVSELKTLEEKINQRDEHIAKLEKTLQAGNARIRPLESEVEKAHYLELELRNKLEASSQRAAALEDKLNTRNGTISSLENEIDAMQKKITPLEESLSQRDLRIAALEQELIQAKHQIPSLREHIHAQDAHVQSLEKQIKDANKVVSINAHTLNNQAEKRTSDKKNEKASEEAVEQKSANKANERATEKPATTNKTVANQPAINKQSIRKLDTYGLKKPNGKADDLKLISGIGEKLEQLLNKCGIYHFEQIANFKRKDVATVDEMLNFRGRIDRDEWIKQARILMRNATAATEKDKPKAKRNTNNSTRPRVKPLGMKRPKGELDDLQLITGVGPKLERKLHRLGIYHFEQIAEFTHEDIELLDSKLGTYRGRVKRDRWPKQAKKLFREFHV